VSYVLSDLKAQYRPPGSPSDPAARKLITPESMPLDRAATETIDRALLQDETLANIYRFNQQ
jgi:hypothetical protein